MSPKIKPGTEQSESENVRPDLDAEYREMREACGLLEETDRTTFTVKGPEAAEFLQGQITNETETLEPGSGGYAALLDRKGHIQTDLRLLRIAEDEFWLDAGTGSAPRAIRHLTTYKIGREVEVTSSERSIVSLIGPGSPEVTGLTPGGEHDFADLSLAGASCLVAGTDLGQDVICDSGDRGEVVAELTRRGAVPVTPAAAEILRVESGRPRYGIEMSEATMPAEAGIVERAVDFNKGCYIGQEPVARLHYRGRPNRHLRGLRFSGPVGRGDTVSNSERELGSVGTAVVSPAFGRIGLAILRKEAEPGDIVTIETATGEVPAEVAGLPFEKGSHE
ncbi:MAG: folate-binding protein YgfZ [Thermoleophilia bacterium]|nr:folate-binding protein YgfZ [Thermoleophilia bacterium]